MSDAPRFSHQFPGVRGLSADEAQELVSKLRTGKKSEQAAARERLISGCGPLVVSLVARHTRQYGRDQHLADDLIGAAMLETIKAVDRLRKNKSEHALSTLANAARHAIRRYAQSDTGLGGLGPESRRQQRKRGVTLPTFTDVDPKDQPEPWARVTREADTLEEIHACCLDDRDRQIVEMRLRDMSPLEIARGLGMADSSKSFISKRLRGIWQRYEARK